MLAWVVLWPAAWLKQRGVTISTENYRKIFMAVFLDAMVHGTDKIKYRPAWLKQVIQSHFAMHGDEIYAEAKAVRTLVENALVLTGKCAPVARPDPMRELAAARALLTVRKPLKPIVKGQLNLL